MTDQHPTRRTLALPALLLTLLFSAFPALAQQARPADEWQFSVMPYLWLPSLDGKLRYGPPPAGGSAPRISVDADTLLGALDFALMVNAEARKGRWFFATDLIALDLSSDSSKVKAIDFNPGPGPVNIANTSLDLGTETEVKGTVWSLAAGYNLVEEPRASFSVLGGLRYFDIEATTRWRLNAVVTGPAGAANFATTGAVTKSDDLLDAIVGVRGRFRLGDGRWFLPYYLDVGGGSSSMTSQGMAGIGREYKWGEVLLAYRYLTYRMGGDKLVEDLTFSGPGIGANFRF
jgi:hypothetical protein